MCGGLDVDEMMGARRLFRYSIGFRIGQNHHHSAPLREITVPRSYVEKLAQIVD